MICCEINRRQFLKGLGFATTARFASLESQASESKPNANDVAAIGIIGMGNQGQFLSLRFPEVAEVRAFCDVNKMRLLPQVHLVKESLARSFADFRDLLSDADVSGVAVATPDHWHALNTIMALAAGKHVYLEPPVCRTLAECRAMIRAEHKYGKVVQVAHLGRANAAAAAVVNHIRNGNLGQVGSVELWSNPDPGPPLCLITEPAPKELNWAMWLGPAKTRAYCHELYDGAWRFDPLLGGGRYRERISAQFAVLPWLTDIKLSGVWKVRPLGSADNGKHVQPQSLVFASPKKMPSIMWQFTESKLNSLGWGMNIIGSKDTVWLAGGDAHCAAETKVFREKLNHQNLDGFDPNHRGNWLAAMSGKQKVTMPLKTAAAGMALAITGQIAWTLGREVSIDLNTLALQDDEATKAESLDYSPPWTLPTGV